MPLTKGIPLSQWPHRKRITLSGTGADETDYIMKLNVHRGFPVGDMTGTDIFLNNGCRTDFSDVRFVDANGNMLEYYIQSSGNYEIITDDMKIGYRSKVYNGAIYASNYILGGVYTSNGIFKSKDNGQTYKKITPDGTTDFYLVYIDSLGNIFGMRDSYLLQKSSDDGVTWATVLDMTAVSGYIEFDKICEDALGNLYAGRYQVANDVAIYKSTNRGDTWTRVFTDTNSQHVHGIAVDPFSGYIYAGLDGQNTPALKKVIRSIDQGANWTTITSGNSCDRTSFVFPSANLRFTSGGNATAPVAIDKTTDDVTFTPVLPIPGSIQLMQILGNHIYGPLVVQNNAGYSQIIQMELDGSNPKTIWEGPWDASDNQFSGLFNLSNPETPTASMERHLLVGKRATGSTVPYKHMRIYDGGQHYQACFHIKLKNLPATGGDIYVIYGNSSAISASSITTYSNPGLALPNPLLRLLMNEGVGTVIADSSGNGRHGTLTHISGKGNWDTVQGRRAGASYPWIVQDGVSYNFTEGDFITVPTDAEIEALTAFTVIAWVKTTNAHASNQQVIFSKGSTGSPSYFPEFALEMRSSFVGVGIEYDVTNQHATGTYGYGLNNGEWHMIGVAVNNIDNPAKVRFIVDAKMTTALTTLTTGINWANGADIKIGGLTGHIYMWNGNAQDIHLYPYAVTQAQVLQLYENRMRSLTEPAVATTLN